MKVHTALGPGFLESVYEACLVHEWRKRGLRTAAHLPLPVNYDGERIDLGFRLDILVENTLVVEIKAVDATMPVHQAPLITFLKLSGKYVGLLSNFNVGSPARWDSPNGARRTTLRLLCVLRV
jgi:GxxExxY protein